MSNVASQQSEYDLPAGDLATVILDDHQQKTDAVFARADWRSEATRFVGSDRAMLLTGVLLLLVAIGIVTFGTLRGESSSELDQPVSTSEPAAVIYGPTQLDTKHETASAEASTPAKIDLGVSSIKIQPGEYSGATITVSIINNGGKALRADQQAQVALLVDGQVRSQQALQGTKAEGGTSQIRYADTTCNGQQARSVAVIVDTTARINEAREANNARTTQVSWPC